MDAIILRTVCLAALLLLAPVLSAQPSLPADAPKGILVDRVAPLAEFGQPTDAFFSDGFETPGQF